MSNDRYEEDVVVEQIRRVHRLPGVGHVEIGRDVFAHEEGEDEGNEGSEAHEVDEDDPHHEITSFESISVAVSPVGFDGIEAPRPLSVIPPAHASTTHLTSQSPIAAARSEDEDIVAVEHEHEGEGDQDADEDAEEQCQQSQPDRPFSPFSHISAGAFTHATTVSSQQPDSAGVLRSSPYMHVSRSASGCVSSASLSASASASALRLPFSSSYSDSGHGHGYGRHSSSASNLPPPPPLPAFSNPSLRSKPSRPSSPFHKNAIPSAKALSTLGIAPPATPALEAAQVYLPAFSVTRPNEGIGFVPFPSKKKKGPKSSLSLSLSSSSSSAKSRGRLANGGKAGKNSLTEMGIWSDPLDAANVKTSVEGAKEGGQGAFQRIAGVFSRRFATVSIGGGR